MGSVVDELMDDSSHSPQSEIVPSGSQADPQPVIIQQPNSSDITTLRTMKLLAEVTSYLTTVIQGQIENANTINGTVVSDLISNLLPQPNPQPVTFPIDRAVIPEP
jgi:hypothetical protein